MINCYLHMSKRILLPAKFLVQESLLLMHSHSCNLASTARARWLVISNGALLGGVPDSPSSDLKWPFARRSPSLSVGSDNAGLSEFSDEDDWRKYSRTLRR